MKSLLFLFVLLSFFQNFPLCADAKENNIPEVVVKPEVAIPEKKPVYAVIKGIFPSNEKALATQAFIQQLLVNTPADGIIESSKLAGFPKEKWIIASVFDSEEKAKWWMEFSDRNNKLPRPFIQKTELIEAQAGLPYFPEAIRDGIRRFSTEEEVLARIHQIADIADLQKKSPLKFLFLSYPRSGDYSYEVEVLQDQGEGKFIAYDFIALDAFDLNRHSRYLESLQAGK